MEDPSVRVTCVHASHCPGCPLIHLTYAEQLLEKRGRVARVLERFSELSECHPSETVAAETVVGYRSRAKLVVARDRLGLFAKGSHRVVDLPECRVLDPAIQVVAGAVRRLLPFGMPLRAVDLRGVDSGVLLTLVVPEGADEPSVRAAAARLTREAPEIVGVAVSHREEGSAQVLGKSPVTITGRSTVPCRVNENGPFHLAAPGSFTQAHRGQQRALFSAIEAAVYRARGGLEGAEVLELYAGAGALSLELASRGARTVAVESFQSSALRVEEAAHAQNLKVTVVAGDAAEHAALLAGRGRRFDAIVVNPPRRGLPPGLRADLARLAPKALVYVSCEPLTLARDLADLARRGMAPESIVPYDMMPLTEEVETLAVLGARAVPLPEVLFADEHLIAVAKAPHEPTTPQGEHLGSLLDRVRMLDGAERAVPVHRLDAGTSGVCLFARGPEHVHTLALALTKGEKEYVTLARGVTRDKGSIRRPLFEHGRPHESRTRYARRAVVSGHSLAVVRPDEGRKHQIRRHLAVIGHPVVGDDRYGDARTNQYFAMRHFLDRPFLHCASICLNHGGRALELRAELAPDLALVLEGLEEGQPHGERRRGHDSD
jgi:23S rRNA (uracil1939-C5)-methyltransferase